MSDQRPVLVPLKGFFGSHASLSDCAYREENGKPVLAFSIAVANTGTGPLYIVLGDPRQDGKGKTVAPATQRIFNDVGEYREKDVGVFERHEEEQGHFHWHYADLAKMELLNNEGIVVNKSNKEGYCLADTFRYNGNLPNSPTSRHFVALACEQKTEVGLSIGWADQYDFTADEQYIEIENVPSGKYWLRLTVNETELVCDIAEPQSVLVNIDHETKRAWSENKDKER